jgi:hypothetical protein
VFPYLGESADQKAEFTRNPDDPVTVVHETLAGHLTYGLVRLRTAGYEDALVVRGAVAARFVRPRTAVDRAESA